MGRGPGPAHGGEGQHGDQRGGSTAGGNATSEHVSQHGPPFDRYNEAVDYQAVCEDAWGNARDYHDVCEDARDKFMSCLLSGSLRSAWMCAACRLLSNSGSPLCLRASLGCGGTRAQGRYATAAEIKDIGDKVAAYHLTEKQRLVGRQTQPGQPLGHGCNPLVAPVTHGDQRGGSTAGGNATSEHVSQHAPPFDRYNEAVDYQAV